MALVLLVASAQAPDDFLDTGVVFAGPVTFTRGETDTTFTVTDHGAVVIVKLSTDDVFSATRRESMPYKWGQVLTQSRDVRIRLADVRDMPSGTRIRKDLLELFLCTIKPQERTDTETLYALQCVAFDEKLRPASPTGDLVLEAGIVVGTPSRSEAERFLNKPRKVIYARLEK